MAKYVTREIVGYKHTFGTTMKDESGNITIGNIQEVYTPVKLGPRALEKRMKEAGANVLIDTVEVKENRRMSIETFIENSEVYVPNKADADDQ